MAAMSAALVLALAVTPVVVCEAAKAVGRARERRAGAQAREAGRVPAFTGGAKGR